MDQKVNPIGLRLGINRTWDSRWYADKDYAGLLHEDLELRKYLEKRLAQAGTSRGLSSARRAPISRSSAPICPSGPPVRWHSTSSRSASRSWTRGWWPRTSPSSLSAVSHSAGQ